MKGKANNPHSALSPALEAIANLHRQELDNFCSNASMVGLCVHGDIEAAPVAQKSVAFYKQFLPLRQNLVALLAASYRRYFRVGLAHPRLAGLDAHNWAWGQLQPAIYAASDWICDWYILACSGENRLIQQIVSLQVDPGTTASLTIPLTARSLAPARSWRSPAWLFSILPSLTGIGRMRPNHAPPTDSEIELSAAHSRLILKGARRVFLWELTAVIETIRNEETAAAAAVPGNVSEQLRGPYEKSSSRGLRDVKALGPKLADVSRYTHALTDKQQLAFSLKHEYGLGLTEIAERMGINRKTAYEHLQAAGKKIDQASANEKHKRRRAKNVRE